MHTAQKTLLTTAFEALGPERVARGLDATGHTWNDCFLVFALGGEAGALARRMEDRWRKERIVGSLLGVPQQIVKEVVAAWDNDEETVRALAREWLELNRAPAPAAPAAPLVRT